MSKKTIWHISDTHGLHQGLKVPTYDLLIFSGDATNYRDPILNKEEFINFLNWFSTLSGPKVFVAGNHDTFVEKREKVARKMVEDAGGIFLLNSSVEVYGLKIWGSPLTPEFNNWAYNRKRGDLYKVWSKIPEDTDIIVTHGPPKGFLDLSENKKRELEQCGCSALTKRIAAIRPKACLFGHIHDFKECRNQGVISREGIIYSNASCVIDGKFDMGLSSHGNILSIE